MDAAFQTDMEQCRTDMAHFDRLPKSIRQAMAEADYNWSAKAIHARCHDLSPARVVTLLEKLDASVVKLAP